MVFSSSGGMPHTPAGGGSIAPPMSELPSNMMSTNDLRSSDSATARRTSALSNGALSRLMIRLVETLVGSSTQTAFGACAFTSFSSGIETSVGNVMSNLPATKPRIAVERFGMMVYSMPSR